MVITDHLTFKNYLIAGVILLSAVPFAPADTEILVLKISIGLVAAVVYLYDTAETEREISDVKSRAAQLQETVEKLRQGEISFEDVDVSGTISGGRFVEGASL